MTDVILKRFEQPDEVSLLERSSMYPDPHDSRVVGDEPYVSLHFLGAGQYAEK